MFGKEPRNPVEKEICQLETELLKIKEKINALAQNLPEEEIQNYEIQKLDGSKTNLLEMFGDKDEMILVHNMGPQCSYCTLWADGFKGFVSYLESRCAFVLETDKDLKEVSKMVENRGWNFSVVSTEGTHLKKEMGFQADNGDNWPGYSTLFKKDGKVFRHASGAFGPGDEYCAVWPMFSRLKNGVNGWQPKYN